MTVDGIIFNCRDHEYGRYRGLESHKGAVFLVFLFSVSWLRFIVARSSPHAHANTKENLFRWEIPKSEAKTSDIDNLAFLACI